MPLFKVNTGTPTFKTVMQVIAFVATLAAQAVAVYSYMKSEFRDVAQEEARVIISEEFEKRSQTVDERDHRLRLLELSNARRDSDQDAIQENSERIETIERKLEDLESLVESNFRQIIRERRRIDKLQE